MIGGRSHSAIRAVTRKRFQQSRTKMAGQYFLSNVRYLDFSWGSAVGFLVQYAQDASEYAVGSRLDYQIEGLTADGKLRFPPISTSVIPICRLLKNMG
jgi:hypothetical protein